MGTTLTGTTPQDTYDSLIKVTDNGPISGTLKALSDGLGNDSTLSLSTTAASIAGTLAVSGDVSIADKIVHIGDTNTAIRFPDADTITFETSGVERVRINSAGNVGIGVTPSAWGGGISSALQGRNGSGIAFGFSGLPVVYHTSNAFFDGTNWIYNATATATLATQNNNDGSFGWLSAPSGTAGTAITFVDRMSINAAGVLNLNQGQIQFPATQVASANANTLDDYEEGTWTMGVAFGGASVGVTYSANTGTYTKIGRQVTVSGVVTLSNKGSSSGDARITGLPFAIPNSFQNYPAASAWFSNITFANQLVAVGQINSTTIRLDEVSLLGTTTNITNADFTNSSEVIISLTYFV
jgi:hypothetical protein